MSDAVSNAEVEDVLSSIRRLVSENRRPVGQVNESTPSEDKLVLTPSLRVSNDAPIGDAHRKPAFVETAGRDNGAKTVDAAPVEAAAVDDAAQSDTVTTFKQRSGILNLGASELVDDEAKPSGSDRLSAKIAALETAIGRISDGWDAEEREVSEFVSAEPLAMAWEDDVELDATGAPIPASKSQETSQAAPEPVENIVEAAPYVEEDDSASQDTAKGFGADEYFDEDMLRDLVEEIVRKELQGALGERITRNVRKLVRREVHRALTAQDLE
ncbi:hypothetical protein [Sulfitobacter sp.]|jgi:hypothetical protein|uniref:hypothetical protein n=1 Tax=Sulfitobacter sp. TaxID=1903071 RepID=UPI0039E24A25